MWWARVIPSLAILWSNVFDGYQESWQRRLRLQPPHEFAGARHKYDLLATSSKVLSETDDSGVDSEALSRWAFETGTLISSFSKLEN